MKRIALLFIYFLVVSGCITEVVDESLIQSVDNREVAEIKTKSTGDTLCYYWYQNEKVYLPVSEDSYFAIFRASVSDGLSRISSLSGIELNDYKYQTSSSKQRDVEEQYVWAKVDSDIAHAYSDEIVYLAPYLTCATTEVGVTDRFYIKLKSENDYDLLLDFAADNGAEIVNENFLPLWYALVCTDLSSENALALSNKAYESGLFDKTDIYLMGNFSWDIYEAPYNDQYYSYQWNLFGEYGIDLETVHSITYGSSSIILAVVDSGIRLDHPDLPIYTSWDAKSGTSPAQLYYESGSAHEHGTKMAGIIGAIPNNNIGIAGIAPGIGLLPISIGTDVMDEAVEVAIKYAADHGAKVISNSYSYASQQERVDAAFQYAINKGCIMVQSSGNYNHTNPRYPYASISEVISVGNITNEGERWVYSQSDGSTYGEHLDVVAPGTNIMTTGVASDYDSCTGTSPACPHVAATAGLILSVNPSLTRHQVADIIECTARKLPGYNFVTQQNRDNGPWNNEVGHGLINPVEALILAQGYYRLIEFDYSYEYINFTITANKDIVIFWDWGTNDITEVSISTPITRTFTHTYTTSKTRRICIAEKIDFSTDDITYYSSAITKFDVLSGDPITNLDIKPNNGSLEYIRIQGGSNFVPQTMTIKNLPALTDLYLTKMEDVNVCVDNCPSLLRFGSSKSIMIVPTIIDPLTLDKSSTSDQTSWPYVPERVRSFDSLTITNCNNLTDISLENVNITQFNFSNLTKLKYLYVSSQGHGIVGGYHNMLAVNARGKWLANSIATLPQRTSNSKGNVVIRCINTSNTEYINAEICQYNANLINTTYGTNKNWNVIWDSGITIVP
ncbi:MAG: S8 family serine peptidase [Bacteroidales bacterium]|nr:S8 family serine peptidase [Bacteroidales bacterium]